LRLSDTDISEEQGESDVSKARYFSKDYFALAHFAEVSSKAFGTHGEGSREGSTHSDQIDSRLMWHSVCRDQVGNRCGCPRIRNSSL